MTTLTSNVSSPDADAPPKDISYENEVHPLVYVNSGKERPDKSKIAVQPGDI